MMLTFLIGWCGIDRQVQRQPCRRWGSAMEEVLCGQQVKQIWVTHETFMSVRLVSWPTWWMYCHWSLFTGGPTLFTVIWASSNKFCTTKTGAERKISQVREEALDRSRSPWRCLTFHSGVDPVPKEAPPVFVLWVVFATVVWHLSMPQAEAPSDRLRWGARVDLRASHVFILLVVQEPSRVRDASDLNPRGQEAHLGCHTVEVDQDTCSTSTAACQVQLACHV